MSILISLAVIWLLLGWVALLVYTDMDVKRFYDTRPEGMPGWIAYILIFFALNYAAIVAPITIVRNVKW